MHINWRKYCSVLLLIHASRAFLAVCSLLSCSPAKCKLQMRAIWKEQQYVPCLSQSLSHTSRRSSAHTTYHSADRHKNTPIRSCLTEHETELDYRERCKEQDGPPKFLGSRRGCCCPRSICRTHWSGLCKERFPVQDLLGGRILLAREPH